MTTAPAFINEIYVVQLYLRNKEGKSRDFLMGVFTSKDQAAYYILRTTGMRVNDDWEVTFIEEENGACAQMYIETYELNEPADGEIFDWIDAEKVEDLDKDGFTV